MNDTSPPTIGFAGLSHLGLVSSIAAAAKGFSVVAYSPDTPLVSQLDAGNLPVHEPGLQDLLATHRSRIKFTDDIAALSSCALIYLSQDIPTNSGNVSDVSVVADLLHELEPRVSRETPVVVLSQVSPGFTRQLCAHYPRLALYYQVETLIFGRAVQRAMEPERFMVGCLHPATPLPAPLQAFLSSFGAPILPMRLESAELAKISINLFLVASLSATNTLAELCEKIGADWNEIRPALHLDKRIGKDAYLAPGLGFAGGNLERDLVTINSLSREYGTDSGFIDACINNSRHRRDHVLRLLHREILSSRPDARIAQWGIAYKQDTHSVKNSPAVALMMDLRGTQVNAYDPQATLPFKATGISQRSSALAACEGADAVVIMTPWAEFSAMDFTQVAETLRGKVVIDPYACVSREKCEAAGLRYLTLGYAEDKV